MPSGDTETLALYLWVKQLQFELQQRAHIFPPMLLVDYSRLEMSINALRVGLEVRIQPMPAPVRKVVNHPAGLPLDPPDLPC